MRCPVCHIDMMVVEYEKIELDHCLKCHGTWFDASELELLLATMGADRAGPALTLTPMTSTVEKGRRCPICRKKMDKATIGDEGKVLIDTCPRGDGLWIDGGELVHIVTELAKKSDGKLDATGIIAFLGSAFAAEGEDSEKS
ncbi:MAG: zf-TFIIB domain-containing protein [Chloroflexi bacterium]|nr:zf-TFIIB domain-containing protein [Chloroflexota bacterium]